MSFDDQNDESDEQYRRRKWTIADGVVARVASFCPSCEGEPALDMDENCRVRVVCNYQCGEGQNGAFHDTAQAAVEDWNGWARK